MKNVIKREQCKLACGLPSVNILSKVSKFKVLFYLKKSNLDKQGKVPIMGRITLNNSMAQFSCKLSCNPKLWNSRSSRLEGKSREATETNVKIERILLSVNAAFDNLVKRNVAFTATSVKEMMQACMFCAALNSVYSIKPLLCRGLWLSSVIGLPIQTCSWQ